MVIVAAKPDKVQLSHMQKFQPHLSQLLHVGYQPLSAPKLLATQQRGRMSLCPLGSGLDIQGTNLGRLGDSLGLIPQVVINLTGQLFIAAFTKYRIYCNIDGDT